MNLPEEHISEPHAFIFSFEMAELSESLIVQYGLSANYIDSKSCRDVFPEHIELNHGTFSNHSDLLDFPSVDVFQMEGRLTLTCGCLEERNKLCEHQQLVLTAILRRDELNVFFNPSLRHEKLKKFAQDFGLENEQDLDQYFLLTLEYNKLIIIPKNPALFPVTKDSLKLMQEMLLPATNHLKSAAFYEGETMCVVMREHKHYKHLVIELYRGQTTKEGKIKNPLSVVAPMDLIWEHENQHAVKFYSGIHKFQQHSDVKRSVSDLAALRAVVANPLDYDFYYHLSEISEKISVNSIVPVKLKMLQEEISLSVDSKGSFYELSGNVTIKDVSYELKDLNLLFSYFIQIEETFYLVDQLEVLGMMDLLKKKQENLLIHANKFKEFKMHLLSGLEDKVNVEYKHIAPATQAQLKQQDFHLENEKIIYLSDFGGHVMIIPVMRYGEIEIQTRTKKNIYSVDKKGNDFIVKRDDAAELNFTLMLIRQHPHLEEQQENGLHYFYLHKTYFLDEEWFLNTFEEWQNNQITILGFNEIEGNKLNPNKPKIDIKVLSGINWFNAEIDVKFGKKKASLKHLHKAIRNKSKFVELGDGTQGILPLEWIEKFAEYFNASEITEAGKLLIPKINFSVISELFEEAMLEEEVKNELQYYQDRFAHFESIQEIEVPKGLKGTLRSYQREGLNWLNFLDDFNFGGCLADDMGLGKSIQIIAFILSQRQKVSHNVNLIVVPATLIFNWKMEIEKFAPSIHVRIIHGSSRMKNTHDFDQFEVILTSYGTLLSDIHYLKSYHFNYIFLDESQNIKNPETERYKAIRLLQSRNKIVATGTPMENNTFDLYGQFSFACPGLLGNKQYFRDVYSIPIDTFKERRRTQELQDKIRPFMLRRTKQQVARELPDKTEMVLYCEMGADQRELYNKYEKEFREYISATDNEELNKNSMNVLKGLTRLRQLCDSPKLLGSDSMTGDIASSKIEMLLEQIENKIPKHKILIFSQFVSMLDLIEAELKIKGISSVKLTGKTKNREKMVNDFQSDPEVKVFLISLKAGGIGLNLTAADYVYLVDPWWNPAVENQAIDRAHRIGQHQNVMAVRLICPGTIEEKIVQLQETKKELTDDLILTDTSFLKSLSKADLLKLLQ